MEAQRGHIARIQNGPASYLHAESMGSIVNNLQSVLVTFSPYLSAISWMRSVSQGLP